MTEIRIDNRPVAIDDISIELVAYNPLADESADHTLDIDIDLSHPANAAALGHIGRLDRDIAAAWGESRAGEVLDDGRTVISGRAYLLSVADGRAKVQVVGDNHARVTSEDDDWGMMGRRIDRLAGDETVDTGSPAHWTEVTGDFDAHGGVRLFRLPPADDNQEMYRMDFGCTRQDYDTDPWLYVGATGMPGEAADCPWLVKAAERVYAKAGYAVGRDWLRDNGMARRMVITGDGGTLGGMLPPWSLAKLTVELERLTGSVITFDQGTGTVNIDPLAASMARTADIDVFDDWELEVEDEGEGLNVYENVRYAFTDDCKEWQQADLSEEQTALLDIEAEPSAPPEAGDIDKAAADGNKVFRTDYGYYAVVGQEGHAVPVMTYQHLGLYEADNVRELAIVPCPHKAVFPLFGNVSTPGQPAPDPYCCYHTAVPAPLDVEREEPPEPVTAATVIYDGPTDEGVDNGTLMQFAVYNGFAYDPHETHYTLTLPGILVPHSAYLPPDQYAVSAYQSLGERLKAADYAPTLANLAREFRWAESMGALRSRHRYKVRAVWPWTRDLQTLRARVRGKLYVIRSVKHTLTARGFDPVAEIEMYPLGD